MAKDDERPQFNPKHRIAGAIILVSLAVIFVPMLLDESTPPAENQTLTQIPERDAPVSDTKVAVTPLTPTPESGAAQSASTPTAAAPVKPETPPAVADVSKPQSNAAPGDSAEKKPETLARTKPVAAQPGDVAEKVTKGWVVQVGTFANSGNAERLRERLKELGYAVDAESVTVQGGKAVRLRVGPYRDKSAAAKAKAQLQKDLNIQGLVLAYP